MIIILGSKNPSKKRSVELALKELNIEDYQIITVDANSNVNSKPIGYEIIRGCENRNNDVREYCIKNEIEYDYICSIEGGFSLDENGIPFVVTYSIIEDKNGKKSTGKSLGIRLSKEMFDHIKKGKSLNKVIEMINENENNKQKEGITGYLTNGLYNRDSVDKDAVASALIPFIFKEKRDKLKEKIKEISV